MHVGYCNIFVSYRKIDLMGRFKRSETLEEKVQRLERENRELRRRVQELEQGRANPTPHPSGDWPDMHRPPVNTPPPFIY